VELCNQQSQVTAEKAIEEATGLELEVIENQVNAAVNVMNCYMNAENSEQLARCAELEAQLMGAQPTSF
jgi:type III secretory pathway lipoprotein EscJ